MNARYISSKSLPEEDTWYSLIKVSLVNPSNTALGEEDSDERWISPTWPIFNWEIQRIGVVLWGIGKLEETINGDLNGIKNKLVKFP